MDDHPDPSKLWRFRRRHSFIAHYSMLVLTALILGAEILKPGTAQALGILIPTVYGSLTLIVLAYIANCAVEAWIDRAR